MVDVVSNRVANLHNELIDLARLPDGMRFLMPCSIDAAAHRPKTCDGIAMLDLWHSALSVGQPLPQLPLHLAGDYFIRVDLESACQEGCTKRGLMPVAQASFQAQPIKQ